MNIKDFTTEQLEFISSFSKTDIKSEIKKRHEAEKKNNFQLNINDCFISKVDENIYHLYKIIDINQQTNEIIYDSLMINKSQIEYYDEDVVEKEYAFFNECEKFDVKTFNLIIKLTDRYNNEVNKLHETLFNDCVNLIKSKI